MEQPFGRWLVGIAGVVTIGIGFWRLYQAYKIKFRQQLNLNGITIQQKNWLVSISRFGLCLATEQFWSLRDFLTVTVPLRVIGNLNFYRL